MSKFRFLLVLLTVPWDRASLVVCENSKLPDNFLHEKLQRAVLQKNVDGNLVRDRIEAATAGLISSFGPRILNACPQAATRIGALGCVGCSWETSKTSHPKQSCSLETIVGYYQHAAVSAWVFAALVGAGIFTIAFVPRSDHRRDRIQTTQDRDVGLRIPSKIRKELAMLWVIYFCSNFFFAFLLSYFVLCDVSIAAQAHDATVLTLEIGLLAFTLFKYFFPGVKMKHGHMLLHNHNSIWMRRLGFIITLVIPGLVFISWLFARRFAEVQFLPSLRGRYDDRHYNLCYIDSFYDDARATTAIAYLKGFLQLISALLFLLGGFGSMWIVCRILNLIAVYTLVGAQFYFGRPVMRVTGPMNIISEALAFDFVELTVSHAFVVLGLIELVEYYLDIKRQESSQEVPEI